MVVCTLSFPFLISQPVWIDTNNRYVIFEIPSNILLKKIGPRIWITIVMLSWGTIMMAMAAVKNATGLLVARFFLGLTESGLFPGSVYLISLWYTRSEQALRNGLFFSTATMAGAFGGVLAYGIAQMEGVSGLHGMLDQGTNPTCT